MAMLSVTPLEGFCHFFFVWCVFLSVTRSGVHKLRLLPGLTDSVGKRLTKRAIITREKKSSTEILYGAMYEKHVCATVC